MAQLSRKQRYQELRNQLDEETTAAQADIVKPQRLSRVDSASHANKPLYPHDTVRVSPQVKEIPTSPVMEDLLGEVKQYNIDNGNRITDDTQINILKQLDTTTETLKRNQHVLPMSEDEDTSGSTMRIQNEKTQEIPRVVSRQQNAPERIVLSNNDVVRPVDDELDLMEMSHDEFDNVEPEEKPKKKNKKKKTKTKETRDELDAMPSAKIRMKTKDFEKTAKSKKKKKKSEIFLNVILVVLILALVGIIGYLVWTFKNVM